MTMQKARAIAAEMLADIEIEDGGSIYLFKPLTDAGRDWLHEHTETESWQWWNGALVVEHRYAGQLALAAVEKGGLRIK